MARRHPILEKMTQSSTDRYGQILKWVQTGDVLDLGCVNSRPKREKTTDRLEKKVDQLFHMIQKINPRSLGVDIDAEGVAVLQQAGYRILCANAVTMDLGRDFDVVVAGEIIEHLEDPGAFLRNIRRHLRPNGRLLVSTPNPFCDIRISKILRHGQPNVHEDHTCWFDPITLDQLLRRTGFEVTQGTWIYEPGTLFRSWGRLLRRYFAYSFLLVAVPTPAAAQSA